jgi:hypothetical protein
LELETCLLLWWCMAKKTKKMMEKKLAKTADFGTPSEC